MPQRPRSTSSLATTTSSAATSAPGRADQAELLDALGLPSLDELVDAGRARPASASERRSTCRPLAPRPRCWPACASSPAATRCSPR